MAANFGSTGGPKPGSTHAVTQRKAVSDGYAVAGDASKVNLHQPKTTTGAVKVPGLTHRG